MATAQNSMWVEKYRPESLDEIIGHDAIVRRLKTYVDDEEVPHMIFSGPPGTGKTAAITAFAREIYGDAWRQNLTELNASDERGIDTVREKIKSIARSNTAGGVPYKIIFLDEADALTPQAQKPLRRIMEEYSDVTRFFLTCNYPTKIINPLQSRCTMLRFGRLSDDKIHSLLDKVVSEEGVSVESDRCLDRIVRDVRGDARSAINSLQSSTIEGEVTEDSVETVVGIVDDGLSKEIVELAIEGSTDEAMTMLDMELLKKGANTQVLADSFLRVLKRMDFPAPGRRRAIDKLAECDWRVSQGVNPNVQWHSFIADINVCYHLTYDSYEGGGDQ